MFEVINFFFNVFFFNYSTDKYMYKFDYSLCIISVSGEFSIDT